jgi:hypothetical protein
MSDIILYGLAIEIWALILSFVAIIFTLLKDFIIPLCFKPKLDFECKNISPYKVNNLLDNSPSNKKIQTEILRFSVKNIGKSPALNCICKIKKILQDDLEYGDYEGLSLKWGSLNEDITSNSQEKRIHLGIDETEFVDLITILKDNNKCMFLSNYHPNLKNNYPIALNHNYKILILVSGDNFKSYKLTFEINKKNEIKLLLVISP